MEMTWGWSGVGNEPWGSKLRGKWEGLKDAVSRTVDNVGDLEAKFVIPATENEKKEDSPKKIAAANWERWTEELVADGAEVNSATMRAKCEAALEGMREQLKLRPRTLGRIEQSFQMRLIHMRTRELKKGGRQLGYKELFRQELGKKDEGGESKPELQLDKPVKTTTIGQDIAEYLRGQRISKEQVAVGVGALAVITVAIAVGAKYGGEAIRESIRTSVENPVGVMATAIWNWFGLK
jgi:hypothetical protein